MTTVRLGGLQYGFKKKIFFGVFWVEFEFEQGCRAYHDAHLGPFKIIEDYFGLLETI